MANRAQPVACLTGASGMIGSKIIPGLLAKGYRVRALTHKTRVPDPRIEVVTGDLRDAASLKRLVADAEVLFHCAAALQDQAAMWEVNVRGTDVLLSQAEEAGVGFFCYLSSAGVVGKTNEIWVDETSNCQPQNLYEQSKLQAERLVQQYQRSFRVVILRPTNVIDEERPGALALPMRSSWADRLSLFIKGSECAHVIHADDVAAAALHFMDRPLPAPSCFFVSCDHDPLNTFAGLWALYSAYQENCPIDQVVPEFHMPLIIPHLLRRLWRGQGNRGDVRYSSQRLLATGFTFPLGVKGAVQQIMLKQNLVKR